MKLIGLAGPARVGKDTIADYLVEKYGFLKFSFSDSLYTEVAKAFDVDEAALRRDDLKEEPAQWLALKRCDDKAFVEACLAEEGFPMSQYATAECVGAAKTGFIIDPRSPRWVLQRWGTAYRRAQDPDYWIKRTDEFVKTYLEAVGRGDIPNAGGLVNTSVRFPNECEYIRANNGEVWHIHRRTAEAKHLGTYVSELRLEAKDADRVLLNNSTIERLRTATSLFMQGAGKCIILEGDNNG